MAALSRRHIRSQGWPAWNLLSDPLVWPGLVEVVPVLAHQPSEVLQFMTAHWDSLCGCDFFAVEALGLAGTVRYMVFVAPPVVGIERI